MSIYIRTYVHTNAITCTNNVKTLFRCLGQFKRPEFMQYTTVIATTKADYSSFVRVCELVLSRGVGTSLDVSQEHTIVGPFYNRHFGPDISLLLRNRGFHHSEDTYTYAQWNPLKTKLKGLSLNVEFHLNRTQIHTDTHPRA